MNLSCCVLSSFICVCLCYVSTWTDLLSKPCHSPWQQWDIDIALTARRSRHFGVDLFHQKLNGIITDRYSGFFGVCSVGPGQEIFLDFCQRINLWIAGMKLEPCQPLTMLHAERYEMPGAWVTIQYDDTNIRREGFRCGEFSHFHLFGRKNSFSVWMMVTKGEVWWKIMILSW